MGTIRKAEERDLDKVKQLTDAYISVDFYSLADLKEIIQNPEHELFVYENEQKEIVAYLYMFCAVLQEALHALHIPGELLESRGILPETTIAVFKTTCTHKNYRSKGILTRLVAYTIDEVKRKQLHTILLTALQIPSEKIPAHTVLKQSEFTAVGTVKHPWESIRAYCPYCKKDHCICDAVVYIKEV